MTLVCCGIFLVVFSLAVFKGLSHKHWQIQAWAVTAKSRGWSRLAWSSLPRRWGWVILKQFLQKAYKQRKFFTVGQALYENGQNAFSFSGTLPLTTVTC